MTTNSPDKIVDRRSPAFIENGKATRIKPGEVRNPKGRPPKAFSITSIAKAMIDKDPAIAEEIALSWLLQAKAGDRDARRDFQDRTEGKVTQPIGGDKDKPLIIRVIYDEKDTGKENNV